MNRATPAVGSVFYIDSICEEGGVLDMLFPMCYTVKKAGRK